MPNMQCDNRSFEDEKVTVLYGQCSGCDCEDEE
nr:GapA-binding peptide SR1P [Anoxybacillus sp. KU2-6(11)]